MELSSFAQFTEANGGTITTETLSDGSVVRVCHFDKAEKTSGVEQEITAGLIGKACLKASEDTAFAS